MELEKEYTFTNYFTGSGQLFHPEALCSQKEDPWDMCKLRRDGNCTEEHFHECNSNGWRNSVKRYLVHKLEQ